jgi:FtsP/CotA-like multicopper oxidase with cupredoxin domain
VWGYAATAAGPAQVPGPVLVANAGETVVVILHNGLAESTALLVAGQDLAPDATGAAPGLDASYTFTAREGTHLYQAGLLPNAQHQAAMGLYGALVVRPVLGSPPTDGAGHTYAGQAYADAAVPPASAYDDEAVVVLSEIDPALNASPSTFDMRNYAPRYRLINGQAFPATAPIPAAAGDRVLLRYVNAGIQHHSMGTLGLDQTLVAIDGSPYSISRRVVAETIAPGQTLDAIAAVPAAASLGTRYALYDANMMLVNSSASGFGGMLTFVTVTGASAPPPSGPATTGVALSPNPTTGGNVAVSATVTGATGAEYYVDSLSSAPGALTVSGSTASGTIPASVADALASGSHNVYVRATDGATWGAPNFAVLVIDKVGPATTGLVLSPGVANGSAVGVSATADDRASGNGNIAAAEISVDGNAAVAALVTPAGTAPVASVTGSIAAASLAPGAHTVSVWSRDALGNLGAPATATLTVDRAGPTASTLLASPNPTNGRRGVNSSTAAVRVGAQVADAGSTVAGGEAFVDPAVPADGSGFPLVPADGVFDAALEAAFADIPLSTVVQLADGNHTVAVHGRDAAGNWGAFASLTLVVDKGVPTLTGISVPARAIIGSPVTLTVNGAADPVVNGSSTGVVGGEYWLGATAPAPGAGTPFSGTSASIPTASLAPGTYTVSARIRDAAFNWSSVASATVIVAPDAIFASGFEPPTPFAGWTRSTANNNRLNATAAAALVGSLGLQAQGNNTNYVQEAFGGTANPAWPTYDARFHFRPNLNTSTGKDIFTAASGTGFTAAQTLFRVRYRLSAGQTQVQIQVGTANTNAVWTNVTSNADNVIEVVYQASGSGGPGAGTLALHVNGAPAQSLPVASAASVTAVRMGAVTATPNNVALHFDAFASKRSVSPLLGP